MSVGRYRHIAAVGQQDDTCCWAACLEWWARATGREETEQWILMEDYDQLWMNSSDGTITREGMISLVSDSRWDMAHQVLPDRSHMTRAVLFAFLRSGPVYTGFYDRNVTGNHVNVIYGMDDAETNPQIFAMEPAASQNEDGSFRGRHVHRSLNYYRTQGEIILASPRQAAGR
ncbi:MAG: hypothetical protein J5I65_14770 [Aridibacter famidurans]|nr:hypothetical protein [Aridibacter famidurans]